MRADEDHREHYPVWIKERSCAIHGPARVELVRAERLDDVETHHQVPQHVLFLHLSHMERVERNIGAQQRKGAEPVGHLNFIASSSASDGSIRDTGPLDYLAFFLDHEGIVRQADPELNPARVEFRSELGLDDPGIRALAALMWAEVSAPGLNSRLYGDALAAALSVRLLRVQGNILAREPVRGGLGDRRLRVVLEYLDGHLAGDVSLGTLAALSGMSVNHFAHAFRQSTGSPPHQYVMRRRMERARVLMAASNLSLTQVALEIGFAGSSQFSTAFKKSVGVTPSAYRAAL